MNNVIVKDGAVLKVAHRFTAQTAGGYAVTGAVADFTLAMYGPDRAVDANTATINEIAAGAYEYLIPLSELASGKGMYTFAVTDAQGYVYPDGPGTFDYLDTYALVTAVTSTSVFDTDLTDAVDDIWIDAWVLPITGNNTYKGPRKITGYDGTTTVGELTTGAFAQVMAIGDAIKLINR